MKLLYTTHASKEAAEKMTALLLTQQLVACVNYFPVTACYMWNGALANEDEIVALYKTSPKRAKAAEAFILANHPYDVPCVIHLDAVANDAYENWVLSETNSD